MGSGGPTALCVVSLGPGRSKEVKDTRVYLGQWQFQTAHLRGKILNVGCNTDGGKLRERFGAINVDLALKDDANGGAIPATVLADARALPFARASFDTVVLG